MKSIMDSSVTVYPPKKIDNPKHIDWFDKTLSRRCGALIKV